MYVEADSTIRRVAIMSVQFGKCNFEGSPIEGPEIDQVGQILARYSPDQEGSFVDEHVAMLYRAFHTTNESHDEIQPYALKSGVVITWDGRLDNRNHLIQELTGRLSAGSTDLAIVAAGYERWGTGCFGKLIGDWAMAVWDPKTRSITLAKDFVGTRHLYYSIIQGQVTWSSVLDPLVLFSGHSLELEEEYLAGWLSFFPAPHLTPYRGIRSVPPGSFVRLSNGVQKTCKYWDFDSKNKIRYRVDAEYEEHFLTVFRESVRRRLRSDAPVLAELSGGVDSSSIVCVADDIIASEASGPRLHTISYYDDSESNWNERPYFTLIEKKRGRAGCHVNICDEKHRRIAGNGGDPRYAPGSTANRGNAHLQFAECMKTQRCRVVLSGIGGDEVLGGVPTAMPELADLLASAKLRTLVHQLKAWALAARKPWFHLAYDAVRLFFSPAVGGISPQTAPAPWICADFAKRYRAALSGYRSRIKIFGVAPSMQENLFALEGLRRQIACTVLSKEPLYEKRYPYLDRDLLDFLFAIPRNQLIRPNQRRSLMRRALRGTVPDEVLNRRRKAFVNRAPVTTISEELTELNSQAGRLRIASLGVVDEERLKMEMRRANQGGEVAMVPLLRALTLEAWLKGLVNRKVLIATGATET
jgi:asparagine synthase (glutamine-hydrolysing)